MLDEKIGLITCDGQVSFGKAWSVVSAMVTTAITTSVMSSTAVMVMMTTAAMMVVMMMTAIMMVMVVTVIISKHLRICSPSMTVGMPCA